MVCKTQVMLAVSLSLSTLASAQDASTALPVLEASAIDERKPQAELPTTSSVYSFQLSDERIRSIVRDAAVFQRVGWRVIEISPLDNEIPPSRVAAEMKLPDGPRFETPATIECRLFDCIAYDAQRNVISSQPTASAQLDGTNQTWLSCQSSGNDMLSTFERFDHCRGVDIGIKSFY